MQELSIIFKKSILAIQKYWLALLIITFITEGVVLFTGNIWSNFLNQQNFSLFGGVQGLVKGILGFAVISILTPVGKSATAYLIYKKDIKWLAAPQAYLAVMKKLHLVLIAGLIWFIGTFVGLFFFIIPGVVFFFGSQFAIQILVVENLGILDAFKKSRKLVKQNIWVLIAVFLIVEIGQGIIGGLIASTILSFLPAINSAILDWLVATFMAFLVYVPIAVMYLERKERAENEM